MSAENVQIVRGLYEALARRDPGSALEHYAPDIEWDISAAGYPIDWFGSFKSIRLDPSEFVDSGDDVLVSVREHARGRESGIDVERDHWAVWTLRDGKVVRLRVFAERRDAVWALGFPLRIDTDRLVLRRLTEDDRDGFAAIWADPDVAAALRPNGAPSADYMASRFEHHVEHWETHGFGLLAVEERGGDGEIAGWIGPAHPDHVPELEDEVEIGWTLRRPFWGRGLATEGAGTALEAARHALRPERLISLILPGNERSIAVARRIGMAQAGEAGELRVYERRFG